MGDAFCTLAVTTGATGPRLAPFTADPELALASLERLAGVEAGWVLPGHGEAWTAGVEAALTAVRAAGVAHLAQPHASGGQAG